MAWWSLMPGIIVERFTRDGLFVKNKSRILSSLVGEVKVTLEGEEIFI